MAANLALDQFTAGYQASLRAFNEGNLEKAFATLAPDCEYHTIEELMEERVLMGREEVISVFAEELFDLMQGWTVEAVRILQAAEGVFVVLERGHGSGRRSGARVVLDFASVYEVRDLLVVRYRQYSTWGQGLAAAGLDPALAVKARQLPD